MDYETAMTIRGWEWTLRFVLAPIRSQRVTQVRQRLNELGPGIFGSGRPTPVPVKVTGQFYVDAFHLGRGARALHSPGRGACRQPRQA